MDILSIYRGLTLPMKNITGENAFRQMNKANDWEKQTGRPVIHTEIGQIEKPIPRVLLEGIIKSLNNEQTGYVVSPGIPSLRQAVADYVQSKTRAPITLDRVIITPGAKPGLTTAIVALTKKGDGVACPVPGYSIYSDMADFFGNRLYPLYLNPANHFRIDPDDFRKIAPRVKLLFLNSPHNPTGSVASWSEIQEIAKIAQRNGVFVVSDESYSEIMLTDKPARSIYEVEGLRGQTIYLGSSSKTLGFSGGRIGWCIAPDPSTAEKLTTFLGNIYSCCPEFNQAGVAAALQSLAESGEAKQWLDELKLHLKKCLKILLSGLTPIETIKCHEPEGAFYLWVDISRTGMSCKQFTDKLLEQQWLSVLRGTSFGPTGEGYIRICFGGLTLEEAEIIPDRIRDFVTS